MKKEKLIKALKELLAYSESKVCQHETTHRGGVIWEICSDCGAKWADDEGGKPKFTWPKEIESARRIIDVDKLVNGVNITL